MMTIRDRLGYGALALVAIVVPLELLLDPRNVFYGDWTHHVWMLSHFASFFRAHWTFPDVIHTQEIVGLAHPIFYAHWFYAIGGLLSSAIGPDMAIRIIVLVLMLGQFYCVFQLFAAYSRNHTFSCVVALLVTWSIYPLTNLYNRGAVTEFAALCFLNMSLCSLLHSLAVAGRRNQTLTVFTSFLFFTLAALCHPITGTLGGIVVSLLVLVIAVCQRDRRHLFLASIGGGLLSFLVLAPWLYALLHFARDLPVNQIGDLTTYPFDTFLGRIAPFPFDTRSLYNGNNVQTPYLDAQINMAIVALLVALGIAFRRAGASRASSPASPLFRRSVTSPLFNRVVAVSSALAFVYLFVISLGLVPAAVPRLIARAQFGYRFVAYQNLCLLLLALAATQVFAMRPYRRDVIAGGIAAALTLSLTGVVQKVVHASTVRDSGGSWRTEKQRLTLPGGFYSAGDYNVAQGASAESDAAGDQVALAFSPSSGTDFSAILPVRLDLARDSTVRSNVYLFPWNRIFVDSTEAPRQYYKVRKFSTEFSLTSVRVAAGRHTVEYRFVPDPVWTFLRHISVAVLSVWCLAVCGTWLGFRHKRSSQRRLSPTDA